MPFKPGQSGNPKGRPKRTMSDGRHLSDLAKEHTEVALGALVKVLVSKRAQSSAIVQAAAAILDRGWGRPQQQISADLKMRAGIVEEIEAARQRAIEATEAAADRYTAFH